MSLMSLVIFNQKINNFSEDLFIYLIKIRVVTVLLNGHFAIQNDKVSADSHKVECCRGHQHH